MPLNQALLPEFDHEMATTRRLLERVPDDKLGWKPHDRSMTMGQLAIHLAMLPHWSESILSEDSFDVATSPPTPKLTSRQEILGLFDQSAAVARKAIAAAGDETMMKTWSLVAGGKTIFAQPRIGVLRGFIMSHSIHHRGQLSVYLRLNDVPVPSIYGPSADENPF
jgi:uncharacterized damage-inducible protein DinB